MKKTLSAIIGIILLLALPGTGLAADKPVSQLPAAATVADDDLLMISAYQDGRYTSKKITFASIRAALGLADAPEHPVTGVASPTAGMLTKWGASGNNIVDGLKIGTMANERWCTYTTADGLTCTETEPVGGGGGIALNDIYSGEM